MKKFNEVREHSLEEKLKASDPAGKYVSDFVHSDNPKFEGKSKSKRIQMALAASYAAKGKSKNEEVEQIDEDKYDRMLSSMLKGKSGERLLKKHSDEVKKSKDIESGKTLNKLVKKNPGVLKTYSDAVKRDKKIYGEEVEQIDEIDMTSTLDSFNKNRPAYAQAKIDTRSAAQRKAETDTKLASQKKPNNPVNLKPASKDDMNKQIAKSYSNHKPGQYVGDSVELDGDTINELSKKQVEEGVMKAVKNLVKKAGKALTGGSDEDQRKDLQRKMGVPQTGKKPMQK